MVESVSQKVFGNLQGWVMNAAFSSGQQEKFLQCSQIIRRGAVTWEKIFNANSA